MVAANSRNCISMQAMRSEGGLSWSERPSLLFLWVWGRGLFFQVMFELWCGEWIVHCSLSTWTVDNWLSIFLGLGAGQTKKFPSFWPIPQRVPYSTLLLSHMFWQMLSSFHLYMWAKGEEPHTSKYNLLFFVASIISFEFNITSVWDRHLPIGWWIIHL